MNKLLAPLAALVSVFTLPPAITILLAGLGSLFFPPTAFAIGILYDALYLPSGHVPYATLVGALGSLFFIFVRRFMKTRIIGA